MTFFLFSGAKYFRVNRGDPGPGPNGSSNPGPISDWGWGDFGKNGIDAALYSGSKCYFFSGAYYIRVTRAANGPGTVDSGYPAPISNWGWGKFGTPEFPGPVNAKESDKTTGGETKIGKTGIDAALYSGSKCYFFAGAYYIRVTRGDTGPGTVDPGYPKPISNWGWGDFGKNGIDAALYAGPKCYFFSGDKYISVTRGDTGAGTIDPGYPAEASGSWGWGNDFGPVLSDALYSPAFTTQPPPTMNAPVIQVHISSPSNNSDVKYLYISGNDFKANESVNLIITASRGGQNPETIPVQVAADGNGHFDYTFEGASGNVCDEDLPPWQYQVQGTGQTSMKSSNTAVAFCNG